MRQCLARILFFLKQNLGVKNVYAYVDEDNIDCLNLLSSLPFDLQPEKLTDFKTGRQAKLFRCPLSEINFQRG